MNEQSLVPEQLTETDSTVYESDTEPKPATADLDAEAPATDLDDEQLLILLEGLLFVASEPAAIERLATALNVSIERVDQGLDQLETQFLNRGIRLQRHNGSAQLVSAPEVADTIEVFLGLDLNTKLSRAALEALAIIAYQQPVIRPQIEAIRGVSSDGVIRTLLHRGLIEEVGRLEQPGRPILYGTTFAFLQYFGLDNVEGLPPLDEEALGELAERAMTEGIDQLESKEEQEEEDIEPDALDFPSPVGEEPAPEG